FQVSALQQGPQLMESGMSLQRHDDCDEKDHTPEISFVVNGVTYRSGYYLVDGIYPELATLVTTIQEPADNDHKRILYKKKQESTKKDVERAFGVLKKKWAILANLTRALRKDRIVNMIYPSGYYLVDGIYSKLASLVKTIPEPVDDDHKRILYKKKQESTRKDVKRASGVLKKKWAVLANPI
nr:hypothetical protein [Tanacetum cinerariifolium]